MPYCKGNFGTQFFNAPKAGEQMLSHDAPRKQRRCIVQKDGAVAMWLLCPLPQLVVRQTPANRTKSHRVPRSFTVGAAVEISGAAQSARPDKELRPWAWRCWAVLAGHLLCCEVLFHPACCAARRCQRWKSTYILMSEVLDPFQQNAALQSATRTPMVCLWQLMHARIGHLAIL